MRPATPGEITAWDTLVARNPDGGHILQTRAWAEFKSRWGWHPRYVIAETTNAEIAVVFLTRTIVGLGELWYAPKAPGIVDATQLLEVMSQRSLWHRAFCIKVEPEVAEGTDVASWRAAGLVKAAGDVQINRATIVIDVARDDDTLLASFKPKTRYNIRLAERKGVTIHRMPVNDETVDVMYRLMAQTQQRAGFTLRRRDYFDAYWRLQHASGQGDFFFASLDSDVLAGVFVTHFGTRAWYKDGGSTARRREVMAPHLLQWEVMRWLRQAGVRSYDLVAVPRPSEMHEEHPLHGLYRFKSGFSETVTEYVGTWDLPLRQRRYAVWTTVGERAVTRLRYRLHRDLLY